MLFSKFLIRHFTISRKFNVAILGSAGGIGQPLSLLLKMNEKQISNLYLYDINNIGMATDLSHIPTNVKVTGADNSDGGNKSIGRILSNADVVLIPAGVPRKPMMTRDGLFSTNAKIIKSLILSCIEYSPKAHILIISNPINSIVPVAHNTFLKNGIQRPSIFGITTLDMIRAQTFIGQYKNMDPSQIKINVIGGHSGTTIIPLLSSVQPHLIFDDKERDEIIKKIQYGGDDVVQAKKGTGSATLAMAYAASIFLNNFLRALSGEPGIVETSYIYNENREPIHYFSEIIELGSNGLSKIIETPKLSQDEEKQMKIATKQLKIDIEIGLNFK